jgi:UPF0755 protein
VAAVVAGFIFLIWMMLALRPVSPKSSNSSSYELVKGARAEEVARQLDEHGIIRSRTAFTIYSIVTGLRRKLQAGTYELSPSDSTPAVIKLMAGGKIAASQLVVPDGVSLSRIRQIAIERGVSATELDAALKATDYTNAALKGRPAGLSLEGYLYPDSYTLPKPASAQVVVQAMLDNLDRKLAATDVAQGFAAQGLSLHQGLTLASIVEKEASKQDDRKMVAQVYLNRLKIGQRLEADPTVIYAANLLGVDFNTALDSPYNTYRVVGLPLGPICSPSLNSMQAVAHPTPNDYYYFLADKQGKTHYARTFAEHQVNVAKYLD